MPTYVYCVVREDGDDGDRFEIEQSMRDPALTHHPESGEPVRRVFLPPTLGLKHTPGREGKLSDPGYAASKGFTRYEKDRGTGRYIKTAGKDGPASFPGT